MAETADVVILGAGFAGASTAWHLAMRGFTDVVLLEAEAGPALHASGRNAALVYQLIREPEEARLAMEGARFFASAPKSFCDRPLFRRCGSLLVAGEEGMAGLEEAARGAAALGLEVETLDAGEVVRRAPPLRGARITGGLDNPHDGVVDIHNLIVAFLGGARLRGARIRYGRRASAIATSGGRVTAVTTGGETIHTPCVVNAAGAWAGEVGELAGVGRRTLQPFRRHVYQTKADRRFDPNGPFVWHDGIDVYYRPEAGGLLMSPCDADPHPAADVQPVPAGERLLRQKLARAFPALGPFEIRSARACLRTYTADGRFLIGRDPGLEGFVWVAGLGGHGMSTSYSVGRFGAAAVLGEPVEESAPFSPARLDA